MNKNQDNSQPLETEISDSIKQENEKISQTKPKFKSRKKFAFYKSAWLAFVLGLLVVGVLASVSQTKFLLQSKANAVPSISLKTAQATVGVNQNFSVDAYLETAGIAVNGAQVVITYDPTRLQFVSIEPGSFFQNNAATLLVNTSSPGLIVAAYGFNPGTQPGYSTTSNPVAKLNFTTLTTGSTVIGWTTNNNLTTKATGLDGNNILSQYLNLSLNVGTILPSVSPQPTVTPAETGKVRGRVLNSVNGSPIANATVNLSVPNQPGKSGLITSVKSNSSGNYELSHSVSGTYELSVTASGYANVSQMIQFNAQNTHDYSFNLIPSGKTKSPNR